MHTELLLEATAVITLGVLAQWIAWRFRIPSIIVLLTFGFIAGPITHLLDVEHLLGELLFPVVGLSVAIILFEGGLSLRFRELLEVGGARVLRRLLTLSVLITWGLSALGAALLIGLDFDLALLLGAILVVTGPTVITPLLNQIRPSKRVGSILMWEGIVIDPVGAVLAVLIFEAIREGEGGLELIILGFEITAVIGFGLGFLAARFLLWLVGKHLIPDYLENPVTLLLVLGTYTLSNVLQPESGLLTVTVLGIVLANQDFEIMGRWKLGGPHRMDIQHIIEFKEILQVLLVSSLFIILSARIELADLNRLGLNTVLFILLLILVVRPLAAFVATMGSSLSIAERIFIAWMAPRGIVAASVVSVFSLELLEIGREDAQLLSPVVFGVIISTVVIYGLTAGPLARRLDLIQSNPQGILIVGAHDWAREIALTIKNLGFDVLVVDTNYANIQAARMQGLKVFYGSIMSDQAGIELDLGGIGRLAAMTLNDDVNSLACLKFARLFGNGCVFQLAPADSYGRQQRVSSDLSGNFLFHADATFDYLNERFNEGAALKTTTLSESFSIQDFYAENGADALPLFVMPRPAALDILTSEAKPKFGPGMTLISLVSSDAEATKGQGDNDAGFEALEEAKERAKS